MVLSVPRSPAFTKLLPSSPIIEQMRQIAVLQKQWEDLRRDQDVLRQQQEEMKRQQEYFRQQQEVARRQEEVYRKQQEVLRWEEDVLRQQEMAIFRQLVGGRVLLDQGPLLLQRALYKAQSRAAEYKNRSALVHLLPTEIVSEISSPASTFSCTIQSGSLSRYALRSLYLMCSENGVLLPWVR